MAHTGNVKDAEDLTSQTFMAALEGIRSFRGSGSFAAWIFGIAARKKAMFFRRSRTKPEVPIEAAQQIPSPNLGTDQLADQRLRLESITHALKQISPERADAIALCFFSELTYAEAGLVLKKSEAATKMLVYTRTARPARTDFTCIRGGTMNDKNLMSREEQLLKSAAQQVNPSPSFHK